MGQQQLLLLVLGIVIVGLAVVVGIQAFSENQRSNVVDGLTNDLVNVASAAQEWALTPEAMGGGGGDYHDRSGNFPQLDDLGIEDPDRSYGTLSAGIHSNSPGFMVMRFMGVNDVSEVTVVGALCGDPNGDVEVFTKEAEYYDGSGAFPEMGCDGEIF